MSETASLTPPQAVTNHPTHAGRQAGVLAARTLACRRGRRLLFRGLDMQLDAGSITWLRGTNGSGKTSLMRILAGLSTPAEGAVTWNGSRCTAPGPARAGASSTSDTPTRSRTT